MIGRYEVRIADLQGARLHIGGFDTLGDAAEFAIALGTFLLPEAKESLTVIDELDGREYRQNSSGEGSSWREHCR